MLNGKAEEIDLPKSRVLNGKVEHGKASEDEHKRKNGKTKTDGEAEAAET